MINLTGILHDVVDKLYDVLPNSNDYNKIINGIYKELINPEGIYLNKLIKENDKLSSEYVQFYRIVMLLHSKNINKKQEIIYFYTATHPIFMGFLKLLGLNYDNNSLPVNNSIVLVILRPLVVK